MTTSVEGTTNAERMEKVRPPAPDRRKAPAPGQQEQYRLAGYLVLGIILGIMIFVGLVYVFYVSTPAIQLPMILTFLVATLIGLAGAMVYLAVLLVADRDMNALTGIWENPRLSRHLLVPLFLISGGLVAAMAQVTKGPMTAGDVWGDFLLGFGWLGAMSGIGGSASAKTNADEVGKKALELDGKTKELEVKGGELQEKTEALKQREQEFEKTIEDYTEQLQQRADREVKRKLEEMKAFFEKLRPTGGTT